jgi:hypothetical protein
MPITSDYVYDEHISANGKPYKGRVLRLSEDWYSVERKRLDVPNAQWERGLAGTAEWLRLTDVEKQWAIDTRMKGERGSPPPTMLGWLTALARSFFRTRK